MTPAELLVKLEPHDPCWEGSQYLKHSNHDSVEDLWKVCERGDFMWWYLIYIGAMNSLPYNIRTALGCSELDLWNEYTELELRGCRLYHRRLAKLIRTYFPEMPMPKEDPN